MYVFYELVGAKGKPRYACDEVVASSSVWLDYKPAILKELYLGFRASDTSHFLTYKERDFYFVELLQAFKSQPYSVLVVSSQAERRKGLCFGS